MWKTTPLPRVTHSKLIQESETKLRINILKDISFVVHESRSSFIDSNVFMYH